MTRRLLVDSEAADEPMRRCATTPRGPASMWRSGSRPRSRPLRRLFLERFPFAVVFFVDADDVHVVAVEALRRSPGYWRGRLR